MQTAPPPTAAVNSHPNGQMLCTVSPGGHSWVWDTPDVDAFLVQENTSKSLCLTTRTPNDELVGRRIE